MPTYMDELINQIKKKRDAKAAGQGKTGKEFDKSGQVKAEKVQQPKIQQEKPRQDKEEIKDAMKKELESIKAKAVPDDVKAQKKSEEKTTEWDVPMQEAKKEKTAKKEQAKKLSVEERLEESYRAEFGGEEPEISNFEKEMEKAPKEQVDAYGETKIYKVKEDPLLYYWTPVARPTGSEKTVINTIKEAATRIISIAPYKIRDPEQRRNVDYPC